METRVDEIAERIYRLSTFLPAVGPKGLTFNQFLVDADEPLLFHCGQRALYPAVSTSASGGAIARPSSAATTCPSRRTASASTRRSTSS
jgi:hypothetical protein